MKGKFEDHSTAWDAMGAIVTSHFSESTNPSNGWRSPVPESPYMNIEYIRFQGDFTKGLTDEEREANRQALSDGVIGVGQVGGYVEHYLYEACEETGVELPPALVLRSVEQYENGAMNIFCYTVEDSRVTGTHATGFIKVRPNVECPRLTSCLECDDYNCAMKGDEHAQVS